MKKFILPILTFMAFSVVVVGATVSQYTDTETSTNNTFNAGTLDLTVNDKEGAEVVHVVRDNMKPQTPYTYQGYNQEFNLKNVGTLPGVVSWKIKNIQNLENSCNEPETSMGDTTCTGDPNQGELGQYTWIQWSRNAAPWGSIGPKFNPLNRPVAN